MNPICTYCETPSDLVTGQKIYPHRKDLYSRSFYYCDNGHDPAYVGCHSGTIKPLGRLANAELRKLKSAVHSRFDRLWVEGTVTRSEAYKWLGEALGIQPKDCHIGMFDVERCNQALGKLKENL